MAPSSRISCTIARKTSDNRGDVSLATRSTWRIVVEGRKIAQSRGADLCMTDALLYRYYDAFNRHQLAEAAALFADGARFESPWGDVGDGRTGYQRFAETWLLAFPTAQLRLQHVEQRNATTCEAYVLATGTHRGMFAFDRYRFPPTEAEVRLHLRELLDIRDGRILRSMIAIDLHDLIQQLATIDYETLRDKLARIRTLSEAIEQAADDLDRQRALALQLGPELDAARHALRPHFTR